MGACLGKSDKKESNVINNKQKPMSKVTTKEELVISKS